MYIILGWFVSGYLDNLHNSVCHNISQMLKDSL